MRAILVILGVIISLISTSIVVAQELESTSCTVEAEESKDRYSKASALEDVLQKLVQSQVPGVSMAVYSEQGWWTGAAGYAKIETKLPMQSCHLMYLQSVAKTYMAVAILKLYEEGKIDLDAPITQYLPALISQYISRAEEISVKMLLNHTSGIPEYNYRAAYITKLLQEPEHQFLPADYLQYIQGKPLDFEPGSRYSYRNTNYEILALIGDAITGDHARYIEDVIDQPLGLHRTFYHGDHGYLNYPEIVNAYWDRHSDGLIENMSLLQRTNVSCMVGDDGIVATPIEAVKFLKGLMEGKLLKPETLQLMMTWAMDKSNKPAYGLGLDIATFAGQTAYGHSGGGIGAGCQLYYFPEKNVYFFIGINLGTVTESPIHPPVEGLLNQIHQILLN